MLTLIETGARLITQAIDTHRNRRVAMATALRTVVTTYRARRAARSLAGVEFCDSCAQVCDAACRAQTHRRSAELLALSHGSVR
jgi:hypothetical protein